MQLSALVGNAFCKVKFALQKTILSRILFAFCGCLWNLAEIPVLFPDENKAAIADCPAIYTGL
jgi:hypothetical protein